MRTFSEYQDLSANTAVYPYAGNGTMTGIQYVIMGLIGEAGELANQAKKIIRDDNSVLTLDRRIKLYHEMGDVLWYLAQLATELGMPLADIAQQNLRKLEDRKNTGQLHGDARG